jgi:PAS domain S-box-containing protein
VEKDLAAGRGKAMTPDSTFQKIEAAQERLKAGMRCVATSPAVETPVIETLQELAISLEELRVAAEELRARNEELIAARQDIEAERRRYQELFEFAPDGYLVTDSEGVIQEANRVAAALLGADLAFLIAKPLLAFVAAEDRPTFQARLTQWQSSDLQAPLQFSDLEFKPCDKGPFSTDLTIGPVHDAGGRITNLRWLLRDVTERRRIEKELERQRTFFKQVIDMNPNLIFVKDSQGRYLLANQAMADAYQTTPERMMGKTDADLGSLAEESAKFHQDDVQVLQTGAEKFIPEEKWTLASGEVRYFQTTKRPLVDDQGKTIRVVAVSVDITGRERAEEALKDSQQRFQSLFEDSPIPIWEQDFSAVREALEKLRDAGVADFYAYFRDHPEIVRDLLSRVRVLDLNQAVLKLHNAQSKEQLLNNLPVIFVEETYKVFALELALIAGGETMFDLEEVVRTLDDEPKWVMMRWAAAAGYESTLSRVLVSVTDITERVRTEEALNRRAAQLALINDIGNKIAAALNLDEVMGRAARLAQEGFGYHHVALFAVDGGQGELVMMARAGDFAHLFPSAHRIKLGQGMVGWVGCHDVRLLVNDVRSEPRYVNFYPDLIPTRAELCVPIRVGQETVGVLDVQSPRINAFDENDVMVMETLAAQVAIAMENARLYEAVQRELAERKRAEEEIRELNKDLERRATEQIALNKASQALTSTLNLETVLRLVLAEVRDLLGMEGATVLLYEPTSNELVFAASDGAGSEKLLGVRMPATAGIAGWIMREGQSALVGNAQRDARFYPGIDALTGLTTRSLLAVPLTFNGAVTGVLETINKVGGELTEHDLEMLTAIASSAAIAIENARLFEEVHTTRELLRGLASHQQAAREEERTRMAREIHDEFGQALTALKMDSVWLAKRLLKSQAVLRQKVDSMLELIDGTIQMVRRIATELRPGLLDDLGLAAAIEWQAQDFAERTGIQCGLRLSDANIAYDRDLATAVFRILQETLTNVIRHAEATQICVELDDRPDELVLIVQDNGKGITQSQISDHTSLGLIGMRERARFWGGDVKFQGEPGQGTTVTVRIPRQSAERSEHD